VTATTAPPVADGVLLDAALEAFAARGFEGTSVREIARQLGVSHNFLPQRFGTKERLWYAAVEHGFRGVLADVTTDDVLATDAAPHEADELAQFRAAVVGFVEAMAKRPALLQIITREATTPGPRLDHLFTTYIEPVGQLGEEILEHLGARGRVRTRSVSLVYFMMTHGAAGALALPALAERFGDPVDARDAEQVHRYAVEAVDVLFDGLVP
jgi:TetR/AcrR family transcriptional regulator